MSEDLQHIDDIFRDAIEPHTGPRSASVWEGLEARLDKDDAVTYKRRYIATRRIAITLFFLLLCLFIYDTNIKKTGLQQFTIQQNKLPATDKVVNPGTKKTDDLSDPDKSLHSKKSFAKRLAPLDRMSDTITVKNPTVAPENYLAEKNKSSFTINQKNKTQISKNDYSHWSSLLPNRNGQQSSASNELNNHSNPIGKVQNKSTNATVFDKWNGEDKSQENKNKYFILPTVLPAVLPYNTKINTDLLTIVTGNGISNATLELSDSLNQVISRVQQQQKKKDNSFKPYWSITAIASPEWTQYNLENDLPDNVSNIQDEKTQIEQRENHEPSFSAGILATYQFKKHWAFQTGLIYSNTAISIDPQKIFAAKESNGQIAYKYNSSSGYAYVTPGFGLPPAVGDSLTTTTAQHNLQYISLPVILKYRLEKKKFSISPGVGITANFLTSAKIQTEVVDALNKEIVNISKLEGAKPFYLGLMAIADIQYKLNNKWSLNCMPSFRYALTPVTKNNVVKTYPYSFGIGFGMSYRF